MKLYEEESVKRLRQRVKASRTAGIITAALAFIICVLLCCLTRTGNASKMLAAVIAVSTLGGWCVILIMTLVYLPSKALLSHADGLMKHPAETVTGTVTAISALYRMPRSIEAARISVDTGEGAVTLTAAAEMLPYIPKAGQSAVFTVRRSYITEVAE